MTLLKVTSIWLMLTQPLVLLTLSLLRVLLCPSPSLEDQKDLTTRDSGESCSFKLFILFSLQDLLTFGLSIAIKLVATRLQTSQLYASETRTRLRPWPRPRLRLRLRPHPCLPVLLRCGSPLPAQLLSGLSLQATAIALLHSALLVPLQHGSETISQGERCSPSH